MLLAQGAVSDRVVPATSIKPSCQLIYAQSIGSAADLIRVSVASHITTTISLWDCVFVKATATIAFTCLGSALLYKSLARAEDSITYHHTQHQPEYNCSVCKLTCMPQWSWGLASIASRSMFVRLKNRCSIRDQTNLLEGQEQPR